MENKRNYEREGNSNTDQIMRQQLYVSHLTVLKHRELFYRIISPNNSVHDLPTKFEENSPSPQQVVFWLQKKIRVQLKEEISF